MLFVMENHSNFEEYYNKYPDSLFILNTRPIYNWLVSRYKHAELHNFQECWCWPISEERTNDWITYRETFYKKVLDFFVDKPTQLLIVNIEKPEWELAVSIFIQKPKHINKHHKNIRDLTNDLSKLILIVQNVSKCLKSRGYNQNELLIKDIDITLYKYLTYL